MNKNDRKFFNRKFSQIDQKFETLDGKYESKTSYLAKVIDASSELMLGMISDMNQKHDELREEVHEMGETLARVDTTLYQFTNGFNRLSAVTTSKLENHENRLVKLETVK